MRDQVAAAARAGIRAVEISSANMTEWDDIAARLAADDVDVLLVSPERLTNPRFREEQLPGLVAPLRPGGRRRGALRLRLGARLPARLPPHPRPARHAARRHPGAGHDGHGERAGGRRRRRAARRRWRRGDHRPRAARPATRCGWACCGCRRDRARLAWLAAHLGDLPGSGIVYTLTVAAAEETAALLRDAGHEVRAYTGRLDDADRKDAEEALRDNEVKALVATSALGMGFDKPDLGFVVHLGAPSSPVSYYQQVGRAGRAVEHADVLLLPGPGGPRDLAVVRHLVDAAGGPRGRRAHRDGRRQGLVGGPAGDGRRRPPVAAGAAAQGARRRRCGRAGAGRLALDRPAVGLRRRPVRPGHRAPARPSSGR